MTNGQPIEIVRRPIVATEQDIIRQTPKVLDRQVSLSLVKEVRPITIPSTTPQLSDPDIAPSPIPTASFIPTGPGKRGLIINIETTGFDPLKHRIIAIGLQDPLKPNEPPVVIMEHDEGLMLSILFSKIDDGAFNEVIGYGFSFDLRFVVVRAMKLGIPCKQFSDMDIYDLMQAMAQVKFQFVYNAQRPPKLSDVGDFFWGFPKPFTDLEMLKFYAQGQFSKVVEFTSSQITRILLLYNLFRGITENPFISATSGPGSSHTELRTISNFLSQSKLTIPEANAPLTWLAKCPVDLSEHDVPIDQAEFKCPIDGTIIKRP